MQNPTHREPRDRENSGRVRESEGGSSPSSRVAHRTILKLWNRLDVIPTRHKNRGSLTSKAEFHHRIRIAQSKPSKGQPAFHEIQEQGSQMARPVILEHLHRIPFGENVDVPLDKT